MKKLFLITAFIFLVSFSNISAQTAGHAKGRNGSLQSKNLNFEGFIIEPNGQYINETVFVNKIQSAILLLKEKSPDEYAIMQQYIGKIRSTRASGANYNE
ncbi:MAG TPA: hypothetical protein PKE69_00900, partial [Pyrinomonadaceae bacterium]|nr:hypothetical protein [Pyrinomonadaceae bacterium]